jgi:hypothetical protein
MEFVTLKYKNLFIRDKRVANPSLLPYDLPLLIKKLKESPGWNNGELAATILLKSPNKQIVLTVLHDETEIKSFQSGDSVTFQIIEGKMKFHSREESIILEKDQIMTLYNKIKFSLTTHDEESAFLLTIKTGSPKPGEN